jgi:hypothetical protein
MVFFVHHFVEIIREILDHDELDHEHYIVEIPDYLVEQGE